MDNGGRISSVEIHPRASATQSATEPIGLVSHPPVTCSPAIEQSSQANVLSTSRLIRSQSESHASAVGTSIGQGHTFCQDGPSTLWARQHLQSSLSPLHDSVCQTESHASVTAATACSINCRYLAGSEMSVLLALCSAAPRSRERGTEFGLAERDAAFGERWLFTLMASQACGLVYECITAMPEHTAFHKLAPSSGATASRCRTSRGAVGASGRSCAIAARSHDINNAPASA